jgi:hypothetical protein
MGVGKQLTGVDAGRKGLAHSAIISAFRNGRVSGMLFRCRTAASLTVDAVRDAVPARSDRLLLVAPV